MTASYDAHRQIDEAELQMKNAEDLLQRFQTMGAALAGLVGRAETADGLVVVEWSQTGLSLLELNPRAMRLPSADLASAISDAIAGATTDLREQVSQALRDAGIAAGERPALQDVQAQIAAIRERTVSQGRAAADEIQRAAAQRRTHG